MDSPNVIHVRDVRHGMTSVYVGRPSKWGNPFVIGVDGTREEVIAKYETWLLAQPELIADAVIELKGMALVCFCAPNPCHGDVLRRIANNE